MDDVVNLRQVRKARDKTEKEAKAAENRIRHGRTGAHDEATGSYDVESTGLDTARELLARHAK